MKHATIKESAFGLAGAFVSAAMMLILSLFRGFGMYERMGEMMQGMHMMYSMGMMGTILGMVEAAVISYLFCYAMAWVYNQCL